MRPGLGHCGRGLPASEEVTEQPQRPLLPWQQLCSDPTQAAHPSTTPVLPLCFPWRHSPGCGGDRGGPSSLLGPCPHSTGWLLRGEVTHPVSTSSCPHVPSTVINMRGSLGSPTATAVCGCDVTPELNPMKLPKRHRGQDRLKVRVELGPRTPGVQHFPRPRPLPTVTLPPWQRHS